MDVLRARVSGTASMMKSAVEREERFVVVVMRERMVVASEAVRRFLEMSFSRSLSGGVVVSWVLCGRMGLYEEDLQI